MNAQEAREWLTVGNWYYNDDWALDVQCVRLGDDKAYFEEAGGSGDSLTYEQVADLHDAGQLYESSAP